MPGCLPSVTWPLPVSRSAKRCFIASAEHPAILNGAVRLVIDPSRLPALTKIVAGAQEVGLKMNPGRSIVTLTWRKSQRDALDDRRERV